jgi:senataxin
MKVDGYQCLKDIFLDYRASNLLRCFAPFTGWKHCLESMIILLEDPSKQYGSYKLDIENAIMSLKEFVRQKHNDKEHVKNDNPLTLDQLTKDEYLSYKENIKNSVMTLEQFVKQRFSDIGEKLKVCMQTLYTHLPTSLIPFEEMKKIPKAIDLLTSLGTSLSKAKLKQILDDHADGESIFDCLGRLNIKREECLCLLRSLLETILLPDLTDKYGIEKFCLMNARLIFCTASSSTRLFTEGMTPVQFLVIDEAAQLKECESVIPLQLPGLHHAILIGDERQLPAVVKSPVNYFSAIFFMI